MKRKIIAVLAIAVVALTLIAAMALSLQGSGDRSSLVGDNSPGTNKGGTQITGALSDNVTTTVPTDLRSGDGHLILSASYLGFGNTSYPYETGKQYTLSIEATTNGTWNGKVVLLAFVSKAGEFIGTSCVNLKSSGTPVSWNLTAVRDRNLAYAHAAEWMTNGSSNYFVELGFSFNTTEVGGYNMTVPGVRCQHWHGHISTPDVDPDACPSDQRNDHCKGGRWGCSDTERKHVTIRSS